MTRDDIIRMAREAGAIILDENPVHTAVIERFAVLVAAAEREACAKVCDLHGLGKTVTAPANLCAAAIRARSQQKGAPS